MTAARTRLVYLVTHPMTARLLLRGQLEWMQDHGFDVTLVTSPGGRRDAETPFTVRTVRMQREISPGSDLAALARLTRELGRLRPQIVNASTPKAGLLGIAAARLAGVPVRIYTLRGLRLETTTGLRRRALTTAERFVCSSAHRVICVSESLRRRCNELALCAPERMTVLESGSSNGVDVERFASTPSATSESLRARHELAGGPVIGFVGRLTRDKGVEDLRHAFAAVRERLPSTRLLLIGDHEPGDPVTRDTRSWIDSDPAVRHLGEVEDTAPYYSLMDVLAFPSHREGMPNAPLEAAAARVPTVGYRVTGTVDAVVDGATGTLVDLGDRRGLAEALLRYLSDDDEARAHGRAARERARERFRPERIWRALEAEYHRLLETHREQAPA